MVEVEEWKRATIEIFQQQISSRDKEISELRETLALVTHRYFIIIFYLFFYFYFLLFFIFYYFIIFIIYYLLFFNIENFNFFK